MKKLIKSIVYAILMVSFSTMVFANSGPVFWQGYPASDSMAIQENTPIMVRNENLIFDFSDNSESFHTIIGRVTAAYTMVNPTNDMQSVQMAFPFVGRLDSFSPEDIAITAGEEPLSYEIYVGDVVNSYGNSLQQDKEVSFDFATTIKNITDEFYRADNFAEDEKGKLYIIEVKPTTDQRINFVVDFNFDAETTKVLTNGFNRYEWNREKTKIATWCYSPETLEIFVLGEDIDLQISAFTDGELKIETDLFTYEIATQEVEFKPYFMDYIKKNSHKERHSMISDTQLYNVYGKALDVHFTRNMAYASEHDFMGEENYQRILTLVYTVDFPQNSEKEVSVSYKTTGTMDRTQTVKPLYSFDYILNPAKNWRDFENLNIKVIPPKEAPYIVKSSIELEKGEDKVYTATLPNLPDEDLSFTLYAHETITLLDKAGGHLKGRFGYFTPFVMIAIGLFIVGVIIRVFKLYKTKE
ncbi:hypothetical protein [Natronincola ferrireducens]|uniref:Uncharacterized protein n=1 Tax=Natronincola ferrireducens TaxID=393762 RepID=A0A1G9DRZ0_9FIRM|nr:hypothetical protein [Natronincola ferrireducens]SDK66679.1 hypothetical protein SAMN05660472_01715 [Natronincola ferrireducens]